MRSVLILLVQILKRFYFLLRHNRVPLSTRVCENVLFVKSKIGKYCYIGRGSVINGCVMGNYCSIAPYVIIGGMEHSYWASSTSTYLSDVHIPADTRSAFPVISVQSPVSIQCCWQS